MTTPYLRWRSRHVSFYEFLSDKEGFLEWKIQFFPKIRRPLSSLLGVKSSVIRTRRIGGAVSIYIQNKDWENRRDVFFPTWNKERFSSYVLGMVHALHKYSW